MQTDITDCFNFLCIHLERLAVKITPLWHPLGFVSCVIDESPLYTTRVHYWPPGERRVKNPDWPIHTHSYGLKSLVLSGSVRDLQYRVEPGNQWSIYSVNYYEGGSEIIRTPRGVNVALAINEIRAAGEQYEVQRGVFHQTQVSNDQAAVTIVLLSDHGTEAPMVLGSEQAEKYPYDRIEYDPALFWTAVRKAINGGARLS